MKRLNYSNSWESDTYTVDGKRIRTLTEVKINGEFYKVTAYDVSVPYLDHGQRGVGISTHYFVKEKVFGISMSFDLNKIIEKKPVYAAEYTLEGE
jgi:hypothetical protein